MFLSHTSKSVFAKRHRPSRRPSPPQCSHFLPLPSLYLFSTSFCFFYQFPQGNPQPPAPPPPQTEKTAALEGIGCFSPCGSPVVKSIILLRSSTRGGFILLKRALNFHPIKRTFLVNDAVDRGHNVDENLIRFLFSPLQQL